MTIISVTLKVIADKMCASSVIMWCFDARVPVSPALGLTTSKEEVVQLLANTTNEASSTWRL